MRFKRICTAAIGAVIFFVIALVFLQTGNQLITIEYNVRYSNEDYLQTYYANDTKEFTDENSSQRQTILKDTDFFVSESITDYSLYRIDFGDIKNNVIINDLVLKFLFLKLPIEEEDMILYEYIDKIVFAGEDINIEAAGYDAKIVFDLSHKVELLNQKLVNANKFLQILYGLIAILGGALFYLFYDKVKVLVLWFLDILKSTSLIAGLAFNDFKMKYAASYLGTIWAFVQPIVTVSIYILVFGYGFKSSPVSDVPFALWLTAGIVPWFFFQDAWTGATNSLFEYSYLVKKVVFKISALPIVKMLSAIFVHAFFTVLTIVLYKAFGYSIKISIIQTIYYTFCIFVLTLGLSYITAACVVFFRDISQVVMIILQFGMWLTPIMWSSDMFGAKIEKILMLNPMFYVVQGYRDSFYSGVWFWQKPRLTIYFWIVAFAIMIIGIKVFKRLEKHFADVL